MKTLNDLYKKVALYGVAAATAAALSLEVGYKSYNESSRLKKIADKNRSIEMAKSNPDSLNHLDSLYFAGGMDRKRSQEYLESRHTRIFSENLKYLSDSTSLPLILEEVGTFGLSCTAYCFVMAGYDEYKRKKVKKKSRK